MSEHSITLTSPTYQLLAQLAQTTRQTIARLIADLAEQPGVYIETRAGVQGGEPCIRGTRVPVWVLAALHKQGDTAEDLLEAYPHLSAEQVYAALSYYYAHRAAIDAVIHAQNIHHQQFVDEPA